MADEGQYPSLVDPQFADYAERVYQTMAARRAYRPPPPAPAPPPENSLLTDIGRGLARGVAVTTPEMFGQALQAYGADETGKEITEAARERGKGEAYRTTGMAGEVASMLPAMAGIGALAFAPGGQVLAPAAGAALFGGSQYTMTREKGGTEGQALATGAIQSVGQAIGGAVAGKLVTGAAKAVQKGALDQGFRSFTNPSLWGTMGRGLIHAEAVQLPTQAAAMGGVAAVEQGLPDTPTAWEAAKHSFAPTALLTAALAPFGMPSIMRTNRSRAGMAAAIQDSTIPENDRMLVVNRIAQQLREADPTGATAWQMEALEALHNGQIPELRSDFKYEAPAKKPLGLPAPGETTPEGTIPMAGPGGPQVPLEVAQQQAAQAAAERNDALWAARNAEEARVTPLRDRPHAGGIEVEERGPVEQIDIGTAPETIDIRAPREIPTYPVEELSTVDIKSPQEYEAANTQNRTTWLKGILGSAGAKVTSKLAGLHSDELALEVQKAWRARGGDASKLKVLSERLEDVYARMTGKNIREPMFADIAEEIKRVEDSTRRLVTDVEGLKGEDKYSALRENARRLRLLKAAQEKTDAIETTAKDVARTEPEPARVATGTEAPGVVEQAVGAGRNAEPGVVARQAAPEGVPEAKVEVPRVITPELPAGAAELLPGEAVPYGASSRRPPTQEELNAALTRKESEGGVAERERTGAQREGEGVNREEPGQERRAGPEDGGRNRDEEGRQVQRDAEAQAIHEEAVAAAESAEATARAKFEEATPELQQARARLAELDAKVDELGQLREAYNEAVRVKNPTPEQFAARQEIQRAIKERAAEQRAIVESGERDALMQQLDMAADVASTLPEHAELSKAVGRTERALQRGEAEQSADPAYYSFGKGLDPREGMGTGSNLRRVFNYLEASKYAGLMPHVMKQIPKELRKIFKAITESFDSALGPRYVTTRRAAGDALRALGGGDDAVKALSSPEHQRFIQYATHIARSIETAARVAEPGKQAEAKYAKAMSEYLKRQAVFDLQNERVAELLRTGAMSLEDARSLMAQIERGRERSLTEFNSRDSADELATKMFNKIYDNLERDIAAADAEGSGLSRINNSMLGSQVGKTPHAAGVLDHLSRMHHNSVIRTVAKLLAAAKPTATIRVIENPDFNGGRYVPATDTIEIGRGGMNTTTMLHEITHALAHAGIIRALGNMERIGLKPQEQKEVEAVKTIQGIMDRFAKIANPDNDAHMLALKDEHEFVSEALNNPDMQRLLGARGWLQKTFDAVRSFVTGWERAPSDFDQLMTAAPTLFGNPNRSLSVEFRSPLNYAARDPFTMVTSALRRLSGFDLLNRNIDKAGPGAWLRQEVLTFGSLNHQKHMFHHLMSASKRRFPQYAATFDKFIGLHDKFRAHIADRQAIQQMVLVEGDEIAKRAMQLQNMDRPALDRTLEMGTEATRLRINASAKSFAEAKARNAQLTMEQWNAPEAQKLRAAYRQAENDSARLRAKYGKDTPTPISIYHEMLDYHDLQLTRGTAERMALMLRTYGAHLVPEIKPLMDRLDSRTQAGSTGDIPMQQQQVALDRAMKEALAEVKKIHEAEVAAGPKAKGAVDAESLREIMGEAYGLHEQQRTVPYMHIGRSGDKMLMFTVKGGDAEWNQIAKLVNGRRQDGGLERGMGPPHEGNRRIYMRFDSDQMYREAVNLLDPHRAKGVLADWADGPIDKNMHSQDSATPGFVRKLRDRINTSEHFDAATKKELVAQLFDTYLQQLPDNSPLKSSASRDGYNGYSTDFIRSFSERAEMGSKSLSRIRSSSRISGTMVELNAAMKELRETPGLQDVKLGVGRYMEEFRGRVDDLNTPVVSPVIDRLRAFPAVWRLGLQPAYWATLMYQPWQVTMPLLGGRFGYGNSLLSMGKNLGLSNAILYQVLKRGWAKTEGADTFTRWASLSNLKLEFAKLTKKDGSPLLTADQLDLLDHVQWQRVLNFGQIHQIARVNPDKQFAGSKAYSVSTIIPHYIEVSNRLISALSAHELMIEQATKQGLKGDALKAVHEKAKEYAVQLIRDSDGDHSQANVARALGRRGLAGKYTPLAVGFQGFYFFMFENMARQFIKLRGGTKAEQKEAAKVLAGITGMTGAMAGALGIPFMGVAAAAANGIGSMFSDPNDPPPDTQKAVRDVLGQMVTGLGATGETARMSEEVLARGLPRLLDIDMSARTGFQDLAPFTPFLADRRKMEDKIKDHFFNMWGPSVGAFAGIATGGHAALQGDWVKFNNDALPAVLRNFGKAYRQANHGYETEGGGNRIPIAAPTGWNLLAQAGGFGAGKRSEQSEASFAFKSNQQLLERRRQEIRNRMYRAFDQGDHEEISRLMQENIRFTLRNPQYPPINIAPGLRQRAEARAIGEATGTGILAGKRALYPIMQQFPQYQ